MRLNNKSTNTIIAGTIAILLLGVLHILLEFPIFVLLGLLVIIGVITSFMVTYFQKTEQPVCKKCKKHMDCTDKMLLSQEEEIRNRQFVFLYKYEYTYTCSHCNEVVHINKTQKNKS